MSKKTKTTSTQTTTPNAPAWVSPQTQTLQTKTADLANLDPHSLIAGADPLQTQAATGAAGLTGQPQAYGDAQDALRKILGASAPQVQSASLLDNLQGYMNPFTKDVVNTSLADYDHGAGQQFAQARLNAGNMDDTFGGSNRLLTDSLLGGEIARGRGSLSAGLYKDAFDTGAGLSNLDAGRRQDASTANATLALQQRAQQAAAAQGLAGIAGAQDANSRANFGLQGDLGSILQALAQAKAGSPLTAQAAINSSYGSLSGLDQLLTGQTTNGTSTTKSGGLGNVLSGVGSLVGTLGSIGLAPFTGGLSLAGLGALGARGALPGAATSAFNGG